MSAAVTKRAWKPFILENKEVIYLVSKCINDISEAFLSEEGTRDEPLLERRKSGLLKVKSGVSFRGPRINICIGDGKI